MKKCRELSGGNECAQLFRKDKSSVYFISDAEHGSGLEQGEIQEITATMENFLRGGMVEDLEIYLDDLEKKSYLYGNRGMWCRSSSEKIFHAKRCVKWNVWQRIFRS